MAAVPREAGRALSALRAATREQHEAIEARVPLAQPGAGRAEYAHHVATLFGWLADNEAVPDRETRLQWLQEDIAAARADGFLVGDIPVMPPRPAGTPAEAMGWAYVMEGSMLGGRVLLDRLGGRLAPWPARYLVGHGSETGRRWRRFLERLDTQVTSEAEIREAVRGAREAFQSLDNWFIRLMVSFAEK